MNYIVRRFGVSVTVKYFECESLTLERHKHLWSNWYTRVFVCIYLWKLTGARFSVNQFY